MDRSSGRGFATKAYWTLNGIEVKTAPGVEAGSKINDLHWYGYAAVGGTISTASLTGSLHKNVTTDPCDPSSLLCANDLELTWDPGKKCILGAQFPFVQLVWTVNHSPVASSPPVVAPCGADGLHYSWTANNTIGMAFWSQGGQPLQATKDTFPSLVTTSPWLTPPVGANDVHVWFTTGVELSTARWTLNGSLLGIITVPAHTSHFDWTTGISTGG